MKKQLLRKITHMLLAAGLCLLPQGEAQGAGYSGQREAMDAGRQIIVGSIADTAALRRTLASLARQKVSAAFVVSAQEVQQYPENISLIKKYGHALILEMTGKQAELRAASGTNEGDVMQGPPMIIGHVETWEPSFRERAARGRAQEQAAPAEKGEEKATEKSIVPADENKDASGQEEKPVVKIKERKDAPAGKAAEKSASAANIEARSTAAAAEDTEDGNKENSSKDNNIDKRIDKQNKDNDAKNQSKAGASEADARELAELDKPAEAGTALKSVGTSDNARKLKLDRPKLTRKERVARDFYSVDEKGAKVKLRYPASAKDGEDIPEWSLVSLTKLSDYGLLSPAEIREILSEPERELLAKFIARAYHENEETKGGHYYDANFELEKLMLEYDTELRNLGYEAGRYAAYGGLPQKRGTKIGGELRYNYVNHDGDDPFDFFDSRVRLRLYVEQPLNDDWTLYGMGEANKSWFRDVKHFLLERLYISGHYKELEITGGRFGEFYADGNVYDGRFDGIRFSGGDKVRVTGEYGRLRDKQRVAAFVASYEEPRYDAEAGIYILDELKGYGSTTIGSLGGMYYIGNFGLGAMYLCSSRSGVTGGSAGYVVTLKYGRNRSWVPGTYEIFAKYYDQPETTYISHTMVGLADYMRGFKGFGIGWYYTLAENIIYGIEYYDLEEKGSGKKGRTLWNHVSLFF